MKQRAWLSLGVAILLVVMPAMATETRIEGADAASSESQAGDVSEPTSVATDDTQESEALGVCVVDEKQQQLIFSTLEDIVAHGTLEAPVTTAAEVASSEEPQE